MTKRLAVMSWLRVELRMPKENRLDHAATSRGGEGNA